MIEIKRPDGDPVRPRLRKSNGSQYGIAGRVNEIVAVSVRRDDPFRTHERAVAPAGLVGILSASGKIYTGVCVDTCSTLGICAERNAIFNMITNGEYEIDRVLCIPPNEGKGAPCGACRELMVQLMPGKYKDIDIMLDYSTGRVMKLGELTPEWWID